MGKPSEGDVISGMGFYGRLTVQVVLALFMKLTISEERGGRWGWAPVTETATNAQRRASVNILQDSSPFTHNIIVEIRQNI